MNILIDTNRYRDFCKGDAVALDVLQQADQVLMPLPVLAELRAGFACGTLARQRSQATERVPGRPAKVRQEVAGIVQHVIGQRP